MAKNKAPKAPPPTPKEKANDKYKVNKEYRKLQKRDKLPGFIITIFVFVIFVGVFAGLYTQFDYELDFDYKEYEDIDISVSSKVLSGQIQNAFLSFFMTLNDVSDLSDNAFSLAFANNNLSDNPDVNLYLLSLKNLALKDIDNIVDPIQKLVWKIDLNRYIKSYSDPDALLLAKGYIFKGRFHKDYSHLWDLNILSVQYPSWNSESIHLKFLELEICHRYNGELYKFCNH